jgi:hypothetical protein
LSRHVAPLSAWPQGRGGCPLSIIFPLQGTLSLPFKAAYAYSPFKYYHFQQGGDRRLSCWSCHARPVGGRVPFPLAPWACVDKRV